MFVLAFVLTTKVAVAEPAAILFKYVQAVVNRNTDGLKEISSIEQYRSVVNDAGGLVRNLEFISEYGNPKGVRIRERKVYSSFSSYDAEVEHSSGDRTDWVFRLDSKEEKIESAACLTPARATAAEIQEFRVEAARIDKRFEDSGGLGNLLDGPAFNPPGGISLGAGSSGGGGLGGSGQVGDTNTPFLNNWYREIVSRRYSRREVDFLFATDRKPTASSPTVDFSGIRNPILSFGAVTVRIPENHKTGNVELPGVWRIFSFEVHRERQKDTKHFSLKRAAFLTEQDFDALIKESKAKSALIFVHGFNNSFEDAVFRNAQMLWDLDYRGLPVLYAWSTKGDGVSDYGFDRDSALFARDGFIRLVQKLQKDLGIERIDVLAHSMGNLVVVDALSTNALVAKPVRIDQLVMAAPDIETESFKKAIPVIKKITKGMTLYASSADVALRASSAIQKFARAGEVPASGPISMRELDTIDVTRLGDEFLGLNHSTFAQNRAVMDDLKLLIDRKLQSPRLSQIRPVPLPPKERRYWRFE